MPYDPAMPALRVLLAAAAGVGTSDLVRLFHRSQLLWGRTVAEEVLLEVGTWLHNRDLPLADANCVLDAGLEPGGDPAAAVAAVGELAGDCPCRGWTPNPSLPADRTVPLVNHLLRAGWVPKPLDVLHLSRVRLQPDPAPAGLTVLPTRAAYGPFRQLVEARSGPLAAELAVLRLDDPHLESMTALRAGVGVATVGIQGAGEVGTVRDLYVTPSDRGRGLGRLMLGRALDASGRSGHRHVLAGVPPGSTGLFAAAGFVAVGRWVQYVRPDDPGPTDPRA